MRWITKRLVEQNFTISAVTHSIPHRATSSTLMNEASSRSHVVATISITQHTTVLPSEGGGGEGEQQQAGIRERVGVQMMTKAKLHLVDLAGACVDD